MVDYLKHGWKPERGRPSGDVTATVATMLSDIEVNGLAAIRRYSQDLDGWNPDSFLVTEQQKQAAADTVDVDLLQEIDFARAQVENFARLQLATMSDLEQETLPGVVLGHRHIPVSAVGSYSPGGRYPLIASSVMTVAVPKVAGVRTVVAAAPPRDNGGIHPPQLYAMASSGADVILCLGGVQALAALAFGIEGLDGMDMIVGAGNAYVAEAKRQLFGTVGIDLLAGPSEIAVIADETADAHLVAADLLGQAEHGPTSPVLLITTDEAFGRRVIGAVEEWLTMWPTAAVAGAAWREYGTVAVCIDADEVVEVSDRYAPEHLEIQTVDPDWFVSRLRNYGSLFIGAESTVAYSDKSIGTNHVLPTMQAARYTGGLWVGKFLKTVTYQRLTAEGTKHVAPSTAAIADAELMAGHALTARIRLER